MRPLLRMTTYEEIQVPKQNQPAPKQGAFRRDRGMKSRTTGTSKSGSIMGKITRLLWGKKSGWDNPGR